MGEPIFRIDFLKNKVFDEHLKIQQAIITVDEEINNKLIRELYTIYKNSKFDSIYIISEPEFKKFLLECLPIYLNRKLDEREEE